MKIRPILDSGFSSWYLLPTIMVGTWRHPGVPVNHGGWLCLLWLHGRIGVRREFNGD